MARATNPPMSLIDQLTLLGVCAAGVTGGGFIVLAAIECGVRAIKRR